MTLAETSRDLRRNAVRDDLADARLADRVFRPRYAEPERRHVSVGVANCHRRPDRGAPLETQFLLGEPVDVFATEGAWAWAQSAVDGYVGYVARGLLDIGPEPTHRVSVPLALLYETPSIRAPTASPMLLGACVAAGPAEPNGSEHFHRVRFGGGDGRSVGGFVLAQHFAPIDAFAPDWVAVAEQFVGTPYLWGGKSWLGIDCSGLVQLALAAAGIAAPRDSDMQAAELGKPVDDPPRRGDLVFWTGHVGIMLDADRLLHANGHHHLTVVEPLAAAVQRHTAKGLPVLSRRRL